MSTESESGWTNQQPQAGFYWMRKDEFLDFVEVDQGGWLRGFKVSDRAVRFAEAGWEWLGPITPADTEQLVRLREAAERTLTMMNEYKERHLVPARFSLAITDLRDTLADPSGEKSKKTVQ